MSKRSVQISKANLDIEMRAIVAKMRHRPIDEVAQIIRERTHAAIDRDYLWELMS